MSLISARSHTFMEIDHEMISMVILLPSADSRRVVVSYKRKYVHIVLVSCLVKLAQKKMWLGEQTVLTAVDWDIKNQIKPNLSLSPTNIECCQHKKGVLSPKLLSQKKIVIAVIAVTKVTVTEKSVNFHQTGCHRKKVKVSPKWLS